jgi:hypothetical protein
MILSAPSLGTLNHVQANPPLNTTTLAPASTLAVNNWLGQ